MEQRSISLSRGGRMLHGVSPECPEWTQHDKDGVSLGCHPERSEGSLSISFQFDDSTNFLRCHPERSEGSLSMGTQMLAALSMTGLDLPATSRLKFMRINRRFLGFHGFPHIRLST